MVIIGSKQNVKILLYDIKIKWKVDSWDKRKGFKIAEVEICKEQHVFFLVERNTRGLLCIIDTTTMI